MKKKFLTTLFLIALTISTNASELNKFIKQSDIETKSTVSVLVKNFNNNKTIYKKNEQKLLNPASILKVLTFGASYYTLGSDYNFETAIYKSENDYYIKLSGDTLLTQSNLNDLIKSLKDKNISNIYIDDSIIDKVPYPDTWAQEDIWPNQRAITPYIIDNNYTNISIKRSSLAPCIEIIQDDDYKLPIINELTLGDKQDIQIKRIYGEDSSIINLKGTIKEDEIIALPVLKPEINFNIKLNKALQKNKITYNKLITSKITPKDAIKISCISHSIKEISRNILVNSDNFSSEVVFKIAAAKHIGYQKSATLDDAINMFNSVYSEQITENIVIKDGSGVSRRNLINSDFMCNCLIYLFKNTDIKTLLPTSSEGTLSDRLLFLNGNLKAKTGTLSNMSSLAGGINTKKGTDVVFCIVTQNSSKRKAVLKHFENSIVGIIYKKY